MDLPLKERFFLQPLSPSEAVARAKESAEAIVGVKPLIEKKAWPYVQNELRNKAGYLRFDLTTIISSKPKEEKKALKSLVASLYASVDKVSRVSFSILYIYVIQWSAFQRRFVDFDSWIMLHGRRASRMPRNTTQRQCPNWTMCCLSCRLYVFDTFRRVQECTFSNYKSKPASRLNCQTVECLAKRNW